MRLVYAKAETLARVRFVVRDEVGDRGKAFEEGKSWWEYWLTVYGDGVELVFEWTTWKSSADIREFLKTLGVEWDRSEVEESSFDGGITCFYKGDALVAKLIASLEPR